ncbi:MAG: heme lyase CcmF/NrfE family subunit, partial [Anaerolineae bacterium]
MLADLGTIFTGLAFASTLYGTGAAYYRITRDDHRWWESARNALYGAAVLLTLAILTLTQAFLSDAFEIRYVAQHSSRVLPFYLKISAVWAGQEGSLLLWSFLQALFTAVAIARPSERARTLVPWATVVLGLVGTFFTGVTLTLSNPFVQLPQTSLDGQGLNPLLRHPGMIFHPPMMYVGYVGLAVPFAFAIAALVTEPKTRWTAALRSWTLVAWIGLSLGLLLGMRWAYDVLGWGGYWGWDPVENAGLMPWITTTAMLHGAVMQDERRGFRVWNYVLVILSFVLVLFGTFATRSGVIQSVHAYARSNLGGVFLSAIIVSLIVGLGLVIRERKQLQSKANTESLLSRDGLFFLTLVLFSTLTLSVFVGSVLPTLTDILIGQSFEAGPDWFDRVTGPQLALIVFLLGICPLVGRAAATLRRLRKWAWVAGVGGLAAVVAGALSGFRKPVSLIGLAFAGLAGSTAMLEFVEGTARRARSGKMAPLNALWDVARRQRRKYGGYLVHLGVILMAVGVIGTRMYPFEQEIVVPTGSSQEIGGYTLVVEALSRDFVEDHVTTWATVSVYQDKEYLVTLEPRVDQYQNYDQLFSVPALQPRVLEDLYIILAGWEPDGATATLKVVINSLVNFLWLGGLIFLAGGALALWPQDLTSPWNIVAGVIVVGSLVGAGWTMWGLPHGAVVYETGRPLVGEPAPNFRLPIVATDTEQVVT